LTGIAILLGFKQRRYALVGEIFRGASLIAR
jgi:hypothetical protein